MSYVMGPKGQIVVAKELRDQLGVGPGWLAIQQVKGDHLEVHFLPPSHRRSLKATLADRIDVMFEAYERRAAERASERTRVPSVDASQHVNGVEAGEPVAAIGDVEQTEPMADVSQALAPASQGAPDVALVPPQGEPSQPPSVTPATPIGQPRRRLGWRR